MTIQFKVYFIPSTDNTDGHDSNGFMIYEGSNIKAADMTKRAAQSWIKDNHLPLRVMFEASK